MPDTLQILEKPIVGFLRRLCLKPELGKGITHISTIPCRDHPTRYEGRLRREIKSHISQLALPTVHEWVEKIRVNPGEVELAVLVSQSPNLEYFGMRDWNSGHRNTVGQWEIPLYIGLLLQAARGLPLKPGRDNSYGRLHTLDLDFFSLSFSMDLAHLFRLPSLRRLSPKRVMRRDEPLTNWPVKP